MEIDSDLPHCDICFETRLVFFIWPCCKKEVCNLCWNQLFKKACPFCRSELRYGSKTINTFQIANFKSKWFIESWPELYCTVKTHLGTNFLYAYMTKEKEELWFAFSRMMLHLAAKKKIDFLSPFSKQSEFAYFFPYEVKKRELYISSLLCNSKNTFIPENNFLAHRSQKSLKLQIWGNIKFETKIKLLKQIGMWSNIQRQINNVNLLIKPPFIRFLDVDPLNTWVEVQNSSRMSLFCYAALVFLPLDYKIQDMDQRDCLFKTFVIATSLTNLILWKGVDECKSDLTVYQKMKIPAVFQHCKDQKEGQEFYQQFSFLALPTMDIFYVKRLLRSIIKTETPIEKRKLLELAMKQSRRSPLATEQILDQLQDADIEIKTIQDKTLYYYIP